MQHTDFHRNCNSIFIFGTWDGYFYKNFIITKSLKRVLVHPYTDMGYTQMTGRRWTTFLYSVILRALPELNIEVFWQMLLFIIEKNQSLDRRRETSEISNVTAKAFLNKLVPHLINIHYLLSSPTVSVKTDWHFGFCFLELICLCGSKFLIVVSDMLTIRRNGNTHVSVTTTVTVRTPVMQGTDPSAVL